MSDVREVIDLTPPPSATVRTVRYVLQAAYGLDPAGHTDLDIILWWKEYEYITKRIGILPTEGTKTLHKELLRYAETHRRHTVDETDASKLIIIEENTTWAQVMQDLKDLHGWPRDPYEETVVLSKLPPGSVVASGLPDTESNVAEKSHDNEGNWLLTGHDALFTSAELEDWADSPWTVLRYGDGD